MKIDSVGAVARAGGDLSASAPIPPEAYLVYYRKQLDADELRGLGFEGEIAEPGSWGRLMNGGASLTVEGRPVGLLYRDLDVVEHWLGEANEGRFELDAVDGWLAGMPSYVLAEELATCETLAGEVPRPEYPDALRESAPDRWRGTAVRALETVEALAGHGDVAACTGLLAKAAVAAAQARLAERGEGVLSEAGIVRRAGLGRAEAILAATGDRPFDLERAASKLRVALALTAASEPAARTG